MVSRRHFLKSTAGAFVAIPFVNIVEAKDRPSNEHLRYDGLYLIQLGDDIEPATEQDILEAKRIVSHNKDFGMILAKMCIDRHSSLSMKTIPLKGSMVLTPPKELYVTVGTPFRMAVPHRDRPATIVDAEDIKRCVEKALSNSNDRHYIVTHHCVWITTERVTPDVGQITMEFKCGCDGEKNPVWRFIGYRNLSVDRSCCDW